MNCWMPFDKSALPSPLPRPVSSPRTCSLAGSEAGEGRGAGAERRPSLSPPSLGVGVGYRARRETDSGQTAEVHLSTSSLSVCGHRGGAAPLLSPRPPARLRFGCDTYIYFFNSWVQQKFELQSLGVWTCFLL
ncbi:hypothetical protein HJG60_009116 [Phyllostomus discolor]|uniref:Uncharacterized protein n=1 Tax=Phyllostomus discolor TaxID=89673 RepID=A0A833YPG2_9CHIR|nr:hypothetical protein HJG60_009116 [Phyllostomus discolor]